MTTQQDTQRKPEWLKVRFPGGPNYIELKGLMRGMALHTVCEEAHCPNIGECWEHRTATFIILGNICTRRCAYCAVPHGRPSPGLDLGEPERLAQTVKKLGLQHVVITSVNRDDLPDGGAAMFAACIRKVREQVPGCSIEVLIPDFKGSEEALATVMEARPEILNHNIETVPRIFPQVRAGGRYRRSLELLRRAKELVLSLPKELVLIPQGGTKEMEGSRFAGLTKSGIIVGMGETWEELLGTMADLREVSCDILTIGQYLRPSPEHTPIARHYTPYEFGELKEAGLRMGFRHVESGPLVRSSYHAWEQAQAAHLG